MAPVSVMEFPSNTTRQAGDDRNQFRRLHRFGQMGLVTCDHCTSSIFRSSESGYGHGRDFPSAFGRKRPEGADQIKAILVRHSEIAEQHMWRLTSYLVKGTAHGGR